MFPFVGKKENAYLGKEHIIGNIRTAEYKVQGKLDCGGVGVAAASREPNLLQRIESKKARCGSIEMYSTVGGRHQKDHL